MKITYYATAWGLFAYETGEFLRESTRSERAASRTAAQHDGGAGVIDASELSRPIARRKLRHIEASLEGPAPEPF